MPLSNREIINEYERREADAGGYTATDAGTVARETAEALGISYERVRAVMLSHWANQGAG